MSNEAFTITLLVPSDRAEELMDRLVDITESVASDWVDRMEVAGATPTDKLVWDPQHPDDEADSTPLDEALRMVEMAGDPDELYEAYEALYAAVKSGTPCQCEGPEGWHCPSEESTHWAKPSGECGHCGWSPAMEARA